MRMETGLHRRRDQIPACLHFEKKILNRYKTDFGNIIRRDPTAVAVCRTVEDVVRVLRYAAKQGIAVTGRGFGYSQCGQSTSDGGIVVDVSAMCEVAPIDHRRHLVT